jgi:hypothetical protein
MPAEPLDSADYDAILELERSPGYALVVERFRQELERKRTELELVSSGSFERGQIAAIRMVLTIPSILKGEAKLKAGMR